MKFISKKLRYDDKFFEGKVPEEINYLPDPNKEYPIFIREELLTAEECDAIVANCLSNGYRKPATVGGFGDPDKAKTINSIRNTEFLLPDEQYRALVVERLEKVRLEVEDYFNLSLVETGETQALGYPVGGHYILHADDSVRQYDDKGNLTHWRVTNPVRKVSGLLYLTDSVEEIDAENQCVGGNLSYDFLFDENDEPFLLEPKKGMYVAFPSNPYFSHRVHEVYEGYRVSIVNWYSTSS